VRAPARAHAHACTPTTPRLTAPRRGRHHRRATSLCRSLPRPTQRHSRARAPSHGERAKPQRRELRRAHVRAWPRRAPPAATPHSAALCSPPPPTSRHPCATSSPVHRSTTRERGRAPLRPAAPPAGRHLLATAALDHPTAFPPL
jgi:hypothetical protein